MADAATIAVTFDVADDCFTVRGATGLADFDLDHPDLALCRTMPGWRRALPTFARTRAQAPRHATRPGPSVATATATPGCRNALTSCVLPLGSLVESCGAVDGDHWDARQVVEEQLDRRLGADPVESFPPSRVERFNPQRRRCSRADCTAACRLVTASLR